MSPAAGAPRPKKGGFPSGGGLGHKASRTRLRGSRRGRKVGPAAVEASPRGAAGGSELPPHHGRRASLGEEARRPGFSRPRTRRGRPRLTLLPQRGAFTPGQVSGLQEPESRQSHKRGRQEQDSLWRREALLFASSRTQTSTPSAQLLRPAVAGLAKEQPGRSPFCRPPVLPRLPSTILGLASGQILLSSALSP